MVARGRGEEFHYDAQWEQVSLLDRKATPVGLPAGLSPKMLAALSIDEQDVAAARARQAAELLAVVDNRHMLLGTPHWQRTGEPSVHLWARPLLAAGIDRVQSPSKRGAGRRRRTEIGSATSGAPPVRPGGRYRIIQTKPLTTTKGRRSR
ncbi:hypothetical protein IC607_02535 [Cellulomonas sp. JH27-2]|uniref:hypothetical protein n=1 Tax=Cellulomonas sp. JH27-2 TaxID=2774139 RepID=UPI0017823684|nr:hypothetical protein [Cellulomonas sp. JH27-2]MBD8057843.1 hypothetical protein [Cellulomonas sp. JH27-2]